MSIKDAFRAFRLALSSNGSAGSAAEDITAGRIIFDRHKKLGDFSNQKVEVDTSINKEALARQILFSDTTPQGVFFEAGGRDGDLSYLLGIKQNLEYDEELYQENRARFDQKFQYMGNDLSPQAGKNVLQGDLCAPTFLENSGFSEGFAAVVYSNNVFEHLKKPWIAARNIYLILQSGGVCVTIVPFSQRYHESPGDYFRYTHAGVAALFEETGPIEPIATGYDILGRRNNWQGQGLAKDIVPLDAFGAWRETWFTFHAFRKP